MNRQRIIALNASLPMNEMTQQFYGNNLLNTAQSATKLSKRCTSQITGINIIFINDCCRIWLAHQVTSAKPLPLLISLLLFLPQKATRSINGRSSSSKTEGISVGSFSLMDSLLALAA